MKKSVVSVIVCIILTIVFLLGTTVSSAEVSGGGGGRPSGGGTVIIPSTPENASGYAFTADISEANNVLYMDLAVPTATSGKYMIINAYKNKSVVGRKTLPVNFTDKLVLMGCTDKPDNLKINVWDSLANIKPIADYTEFESTEENGVQIFAPTKGFPVRYPVSNSVTKSHIAFVTAIGAFGLWDGTTEYEIEVLNSDGSIVVYTFADTITVKENENIKEISNGVLVDGIEKVSKSLVAEYIESLITTEKTTENFAKRIISYNANAAGKITEISFSAKGKDTGLSYVAETTMQHYDAETKMLGNYSISNETIIFYIPTDKNKSEYDVISIDELIQDGKYEVAYLDINDENNAGLLLITDKKNIMGGDTVAVVKNSYYTVDEEGCKIISVNFLQNGEGISLSVDANAEINNLESNMFEKGAVFEYTVNANGKINNAKFCGLLQTDVLTWQEVKANAETIVTIKTQDEPVTYIGGYVIDKIGSAITLSNQFNAVSGSKIDIPLTANVYIIDVARTRINPIADNIGSIVACKYYTENGYDYAEDGEDTFVLIKYIGDEITDVIAYYGFAPSTDPMS